MTQAPPPTATPAAHAFGPGRIAPRPGLALGLAACALFLAGGCAASWNPFTRPDPPAPAGDGVVLRDGRLVKDARPVKGTAAADLEAAKELYQKGEYKKAEGLFGKVADNTKNTPQMIEEARFFEADCQRLQARYPTAAATYKQQLKDFPSGAYQKEALKQLFDIANYWLDETRARMKEYDELRQGKRSFVPPPTFFHWDKTKPLMDEEGSALGALEQVYLNDPVGPLGERALWLIANVRFFHEDFRDADFYFAQILKNYANGEFAPKALEMSILCKQLCPGGPEYDGRKLSEARELVQTAFQSYPDLAARKSEFLHRQVATINMQQAAKDIGIARYYERTFHPGAAYFSYEIVRRRYPGTKYAEEAGKRMAFLRERAQNDLQRAPKTGPNTAVPLNSAPPAGPITPGAAMMAPADRTLPAPPPGR